MCALVYGVELADLPDGCTPIEAIVIVKALDEDSDLCLYRRASIGLAPWDQIGLLTVVLDNMRELGQLHVDVEFEDNFDEDIEE